MGWKRKYSSCSDGIDADELAGDMRLARRWKRKIRSIGYGYLKHNSGSKNSSSEGKGYKTPKKIHDSAEVLVDADYKEYLDSFTEFVSNCSNLKFVHSSEFRGDTMVGNMSLDDALFNKIEMVDKVDDCYKKFLDGLSGLSTGNNNLSKHRFVDNGDSGGDTMVENMSAYDVDSDNADVNWNVLEGESVDVYYQDHLQSLDLEDDHNANFMGSDLDVDAVNGFVKNGNSGQELVGNKFLNNDGDGGDDDAFNNVDPQFKNISESNNMRNNNDKQNAACMEHSDGNPLGQSGDSAAGNDWSVDHMPYEINAVNQSTENGTWGNWSEENGATDAHGRPFQTPSAIDAGYSDGLDNTDPDYKLFLENLRGDGKSYVLEFRLCDGTTLSIKYEPHDSIRVENPDAMRTTREAADLTKLNCKSKLEFDLMDESYKCFLDSMKMEGDHLVFVPKSGAKVVYDEDEASSSDSEVMVLDTDPFADENYTPFVPSKSYVLSDDEGNYCFMGSSRNNGWFRERVMEILKKPYDQKELDRLLNDVYARKPVEVTGEMRGGRSRTRTLEKMGKSYYDIHRDLAVRINAAGSNQPKVLNLLRGFFFWLQNMVHDGVFKPWEDPLCLQELPQGVRF